MSRVDQYQIHIVSEDGRDLGIWTAFDGGGVDSEEAFSRDGYGLPRYALGGAANVQNWTISRTYKVDRDPSLYQYMRKTAGKRRFNGAVQLLDIDGFAVGAPEPYTGILKSVNKDAINVVDGTDVMKISAEFSADGAP